MNGPGNDPCSVTRQIARRRTLILGTTGRGSVPGDKPSPCSRTAPPFAMYARMCEDLDSHGGDVLDGVSIAAKGQEVLDKIIAVASGAQTPSGQLGFAGAEFGPWQIGAVV